MMLKIVFREYGMETGTFLQWKNTNKNTQQEAEFAAVVIPKVFVANSGFQRRKTSSLDYVTTPCQSGFEIRLEERLLCICMYG